MGYNTSFNQKLTNGSGLILGCSHAATSRYLECNTLYILNSVIFFVKSTSLITLLTFYRSYSNPCLMFYIFQSYCLSMLLAFSDAFRIFIIWLFELTAAFEPIKGDTKNSNRVLLFNVIIGFNFVILPKQETTIVCH